MGQKIFLLVPVLIFALLASVLFGCSKQSKNTTAASDKTISIKNKESIISRMYYVTVKGLQMKNEAKLPQYKDLDYLDYWNITFKGGTDSLRISCKGNNGVLRDSYFKYKFEDGFLKVFNSDKPLWEIIGYGDRNRITFLVDYVLYKGVADWPSWTNLKFCPDTTMEDALGLSEKDLFSTVSDLTLGYISNYEDLCDHQEQIYWRLTAYTLE